MANSSPFEVIAGPFTAYIAPVGTTFPTLDEDPADVAGWARIGHSGDINYDRGEGVMVRHQKSINSYRGAGNPLPLKNFVTEENLIIEFQLADMTLETYRLAVNGNAITEVSAAGDVPAHKKISLIVGNSISSYALVLRSDESPYQAVGVSQYNVEKAQEIGSSDVQRGSAGNPGRVRLQFSALVGTAELLSQDATAVTAT
jgi:hypothetical protein